MDSEPELVSVPAETRLKRFLHYTQESGLYVPGKRSKKCFVRENVGSIEQLIADGKVTDSVLHIVKAFSDGYSAYPEGLVFALAMCARQTQSEKLRNAAYNAIKTVCKDAKNFFLFIKFCQCLAEPNSAWGRGARRVVTDWYLKKDPLELADCVTRDRGMFGWTHRNIFQLIHLKSTDVAKSAVLMYVMRGLEEAKLKYGDNAETAAVFVLLQAAEDVKHVDDEQTVARLIDQYKFSANHLPPTRYSSMEVWTALVPHMALPELLGSLKRISWQRLLQTSSPLLTVIVDALSNQTSIAEANLHPAQVLVALRNYGLVGNIRWVPNVPKVAGRPVVQPKIVEALNQLLASSFKLLVPTGLRYLVALDIRPEMWTEKCQQCSHIIAIQAAVLQALCLVQAERDVTVVVFGPEGVVKRAELERDSTFKAAQDFFRATPNGPVDIAKPVMWAKKNRKLIDVFVVMTSNQIKLSKTKPAKAIQLYRTSLGLPNAKYVAVALSCPTMSVANPADPLMLDIVGFDEMVPRVIEAFSRGSF